MFLTHLDSQQQQLSKLKEESKLNLALSYPDFWDLVDCMIHIAFSVNWIQF